MREIRPTRGRFRAHFRCFLVFCIGVGACACGYGEGREARASEENAGDYSADYFRAHIAKDGATETAMDIWRHHPDVWGHLIANIGEGMSEWLRIGVQLAEGVEAGPYSSILWAIGQGLGSNAEATLAALNGARIDLSRVCAISVRLQLDTHNLALRELERRLAAVKSVTRGDLADVRVHVIRLLTFDIQEHRKASGLLVPEIDLSEGKPVRLSVRPLEPSGITMTREALAEGPSPIHSDEDRNACIGYKLAAYATSNMKRLVVERSVADKAGEVHTVETFEVNNRFIRDFLRVKNGKDAKVVGWNSADTVIIETGGLRMALVFSPDGRFRALMLRRNNWGHP